MTPDTWQHDDLYALFDNLCDGSISAADAARLDVILAGDAAARWEYLCYLDVHAGLGLVGFENEPFGLDRALPKPQTVGQSGMLENERHPSESSASVPSIVIQSLPTPHSPLSSFIGSALFSYLVATVVVGLGLAIGAHFHVSQPEQYVGPPGSSRTPNRQSPIPTPSSIVARITGMLDCVWEGSGFRVQGGRAENQKSEIINQKSLLRLGDRLALRSGLLELTYETGAKVLLQGPVTYEVESPAGGYLFLGKLTARLEKSEVRGQRSGSAKRKSENRNQKSFAVRTPTALVTDLGTEFGVEVSKDGNTQSHVFRGSVRVQVTGADSENETNTIVLHQHESVQTRHDASASGPSVRLVRVHLNPQAYVRQIDAPLKTLDLCNIVAGGDGRKQRRPREATPLGGVQETVLVPQAGIGEKSRRSWSDNGLIDGIFLPGGYRGVTRLDSAGHAFDGFPKISGPLQGSISATTTRSLRNADDRTLLGLRSNAGITFDLAEVRKLHSGVRPSRFHATVFRASPADSSTILFEDDFAMGALNSSTVGGRWAVNPGFPPIVELRDAVGGADPANNAGDTRCLKVPSECWAVFNGDTENKCIELSLSIWKGAAQPGWSAVAGFADKIDNDRSFTVYFHSDGAIAYFDGEKKVDTGITYRTRAWQEVKIRANMATQTFSLTVGNDTAKNLHWNGGVNRINHVYFGYGGGSPGECFIADLKVGVTAGLAESQRLGYGKAGRGDFWVFVDGQLKKSQAGLRSRDGRVPVEIELGPDDRFLTLVGVDPANPQTLDWTVFADPVLEMKPVADSED
jgi:hypothetical protein